MENFRRAFRCGRCDLVLLLLAVHLAIPAGAAPAFVRSDNDGIDGFEFSHGGLLWWNTRGVCSGEFPNNATVKMSGTIMSSTHAISDACDIMRGEFDYPVRDEAYAYYFVGRQLVRKAVNATVADAHESVATPPFSPTLAPGQLGSALEIHQRTLFFVRHTNTTGVSVVYSLNLDTTNLTTAATFDSDAPVVRIRYFNYDDNRTVNALAVLTENGRLYRIKLNPIRNEPVVRLLATGVNDFVIRTGGFLLANTYIFATKGGLRNDLGSIPDGGTGTLYRVDPETGDQTLLYTAQDENVLMSVTASGHDYDDDTYLFVAEGIVSGPPNGFQAITDIVLRRHSAKVLTGPWDTILLLGGGENPRVSGERLYFVRTNAILSLPTGAPAIQFDMSAFGLEAVQAIQSFTHSVPLVANRPIYVRGYATMPLNTTGQQYWFGTAHLRGFLNGVELPGGPISPLRSVAIRASANRAIQRSTFTNSFLFELPKEWTRHGPLSVNFLQFTLTVNPDLAIPETVANPLGNNSFTSGPILFVRRGKPCLVMTPVWSRGPEYYANDDPLFPLIIERARSLMPVEDFDVHPFGVVAGDPEEPLNFMYEGSDADTQTERDNENRLYRSGQWGKANDQAEDLGSESDICDSDDIHYVAMVHTDAVITPPGGQGESPGNAIAIRMRGGEGTPQTPRGGRVLAHELGHNYGRHHIACGDFPEDQADFDDVPYPESLGNPDATLAEATFGFDPLTFTVIRPTDACDLMSYSDTLWASAPYWNALLGEVAGPNEFTLHAPAQQTKDAESMVMLARGYIYPDTRTALLRHFSTVAETVAPARIVARSRAEEREAARRDPPYLLRQLDAVGNLLLETAILARSPSYHDHERPLLRFSQYVNFDQRARTLQLVWSNIVFAERFISPHAPILELGTPVLDPAANTISLHWTASDADGDPLRFSIHYTGDDGQHWGALKTDYKALSITLSTRWLAGGSNCRLRVIAHDGVNSTVAVTEPFACPKHAPEPRVHGVREGQIIPFGQPLRLRAVTLDAEEGSASLLRSWELLGSQRYTNDGDTFNLSALPPGPYALKFTAIDSDGQSNVVTRSFAVGPLTIPDATNAPTMDGLPNDAEYVDAAYVELPFLTSKIPVRLVHHDGFLYASISSLRYSPSPLANRTIGLRFDIDASRNPAAMAGDIGFVVDEDGVPFQQIAQGGNMVTTLQPQSGFTAIINRSSNVWSAELRIADALLGGWNHAAGLMISHATTEWPPESLPNAPETWAPVWLGQTPPAGINRAPFADAGSDVELSLGKPSEVSLTGGGSYDPEGAPLTYTWQQISGPAVTLTNTNSVFCEFTAPLVTTNTELRFALTVHDGQMASAPDEVKVILRPPPMPQVLNPPPGLALLLPDGRLQMRLIAEPELVYRVQTSTNLTDWTDVRSAVGDVNGAIDYTTEFSALTDPIRFFRAVFP